MNDDSARKLPSRRTAMIEVERTAQLSAEEPTSEAAAGLFLFAVAKALQAAHALFVMQRRTTLQRQVC
jgi:hypothetical protein